MGSILRGLRRMRRPPDVLFNQDSLSLATVGYSAVHRGGARLVHVLARGWQKLRAVLAPSVVVRAPDPEYVRRLLASGMRRRIARGHQ